MSEKIELCILCVCENFLAKKERMALPLRFVGTFLSIGHQKIRLAKFSVSSVKAKRKVSSEFFKKLSAIMAIPSNKLFVWRQRDTAQTSSSSSKTKSSEQFLQFALEVSSSDGNASKRVYLKRPYDDLFSGFKGRLRQKIKDFLQVTSDDELTVRPIFSDGHSSAVDDIALFKLFFNADEPNRQCSALQIANAEYEVVRDPAWLDKVEISLLPLVGCPVFPSCDWKYAADKVRFLWFVARERLPLRINVVSGNPLAQRVRVEPAEWVHVHTGPYYSPTMGDVGKFLAVVVDVDDGIIVGTVCPTAVAKLGADPPSNNDQQEELIFERRQKECCVQHLSGQRYRLISYNILANLYMNLKKLEQQNLFFPYCPKRFLEANYRYPLILRELEGYNADLMFLQEVDFRMQKRFLVSFLLSKNYSSVFNCKENEVNEGLLIAFCNDRFHSVAEGDEDNFTVKLSKFLEEDPANSDVRLYLAHRERLRDIVGTRPTILQLIRLRAKHDGRDVLCANTHLYFDPAHEEVKIIQTLLCLRYIAKVRTQLDPVDPIQMIFAGDLNSSPDSRAIALIGGDEIRLEMKRDGQNGTTNCTDPLSVLVLRAPFQSQCLSGFPDYTNFTCPAGTAKGFNGCLDYIWAHPPLRAEHIWPMPDHRLVTKYGALPSPIAPSDHLPILCDVRMDGQRSGDGKADDGQRRTIDD